MPLEPQPEDEAGERMMVMPLHPIPPPTLPHNHEWVQNEGVETGIICRVCGVVRAMDLHPAPVSQIGDDAVSLTDPEKLYPERALRQGDEPPRDCEWLPKPIAFDRQLVIRVKSAAALVRFREEWRRRFMGGAGSISTD